MADRKRVPDLSKRLGSVLRSAQDRSLGLRAVRAGLLSEQDLAGPFGVDELLQMKGVTAEQIKELQSEIDREDYALFRPDRPTPPEVLEALSEPDRRLAEFVRVSRLGQGGIGEVWKAWDTRLGRWVAVKLPMATPDQDGASERFTREALAAARLTHPNIVSIHRVAEESGRCFIVMQYVEGQPLRRAKLEPKKALEIVRDVALAVHYAHEQGVIHRDLKPANIMLDLDGRPFVLDFGLAHLEEAGRVQSRENLVAGTAAYMSPEQARGGPAARERATDVYALGATLYEAVTGRAPFDGATFAETLEKVLHGDPVPPRTLEPSLSRDVEMVIQKAMDKEPARRYATAKDFADDLDRCLRGEPVLARQGAMGKTIRRGLRQNPRLPWMAAGVILVAVAVGAWVLGGLERRDAEKRARDQERQGIRDVAQLSVQAMLKLRRAGANEGMGEFLKKVEEAHATAASRDLAGAEIDMLMGRAFRAAMEDEKALDFQSQALSKDPYYSPAIYEKLILEAKKDLSLVRDEVQTYFLNGDASDSPARVIKGLSAIRQSDRTSAQSWLQLVTTEDPFREEAWELLAQTWLASVSPHSAPKEQEEAYRRAEAVFSEGLERDKGYAPFWLGRGKLKASRARLACETGQDPDLDFQSAEDDLTQAIKIRTSGASLVNRARLRIQYGVYRMSRGQNPTTEFSEAEADLEEAARRSPAEPFVLAALSALNRHRGEYRLLRGESPLKDLDALEQKAATFLKGRPLPPEAWMNMGLLWSQQAHFRAGLGEDPSGDYKRVEESFNQAQAWSSPEFQERRAAVMVQKARWRAKPGKDVNEELAAAEAVLDSVIAGSAFFNDALITRARSRRTRGECQVHCNQDPTARFEEALKDLVRVHETNLVSPEAAVERGHLELDWARHRTKLSDRQGAIDHYGKAVRYLEEAVHIQDSLAASLRDPLREARRGLIGP